MTTIYSAFTWIALSTYQKIDLIVDFVDIAFNAIFIVIIIATNVQWENRVRPMRKKKYPSRFLYLYTIQYLSISITNKNVH